jgi:hypothetical protein
MLLMPRDGAIIFADLIDSPYKSRPSKAWLNIKNPKALEQHALQMERSNALFRRYPIAAELRLTLPGPAQLMFLRTTISSLVSARQRVHVVPEAPNNAVARYA